MKNILFITTDQQHFRTLGCNGAPDARTPNLDRLAQDGINFRNHFVANPVCSPSRASIMTGLYPSEHGLWGNGCRLPEHHPTIARVLRDQGWQTAHFGKLHLVPIINRIEPHPAYGFETCEVAEGDQQLLHDEYFNWLRTKNPDLFVQYINEAFQNGQAEGYKSKLPEEWHLSTWVTNRSEDWLVHRRKEGQPFFLNVGFFDPHHPFNPCEPYASMFDEVEMEQAVFEEGSLETRPPYYRQLFESGSKIARNPKRYAEMRRAYFAMVAHLDKCVGRLLAALDATGQRENTVVIFTSDHGEFMGNHSLLWKGPYLLDDLLRVPLIVAGGGAPSGQTVEGLTSTVDLMPTIQTLAGAPEVRKASGRTFVEADFSEPATGYRDAVFTEWDDPKGAGNSCLRCVRTEKGKLVHYPLDPKCGEYYDLVKDPNECWNKFHDPQYADAIADHFGILAHQYLTRRPDIPFEGGW